jgi:hypothetical protein
MFVYTNSVAVRSQQLTLFGEARNGKGKRIFQELQFLQWLCETAGNRKGYFERFQTLNKTKINSEANSISSIQLIVLTIRT